MITEGPDHKVANAEQAKEELLFPIAEVFTSVQGEGTNVGTRMTFIRFAGCTVGKRFPNAHYGTPDSFRNDLKVIQYPSYVNQCTAFDGRTFPCDTNYNLSKKYTLEELLKEIPAGVQWVSITGGEPLMHIDKVRVLCDALAKQQINIQIETSGTIGIPPALRNNPYVYLACSPKGGWLDPVVASADEVRLMVDQNFDETAAQLILDCATGQVYLCPLSTEDDVTRISRKAMAKCLELIAKPAYKDAKISIQQHKVLGVR